MVTISKFPTDNPSEPLPVENCIEFGFLPDDYIVNAGDTSRFVFFFNSGDIQNNGDYWIINGDNYIVSSSANPSTGNFYDGTSSNIELNAVNFAEMLKLNAKFINYNIQILSTGNGSFGVYVESKTVGFQSNWFIDNTNLTVQQNNGSASGANMELRQDYKIIYQLFCADTNLPICEMQAITPSVQIGNGVHLPAYVDFQHELSNAVKTSIPCLTEQFAVKDPFFTKRFYIKYGSRFIVKDCTPIFSDLKTSPTYKVFNTALQINDAIGITPYYFASVDPPQTYLNSSPLSVCVSSDTYLWSLLDVSIFEFFADDELTGIEFDLVTLFRDNGAPVGTFNVDLQINEDGAYNIPVGPNNLLSGIVPPANGYDSYEYQVFCTLQTTGFDFTFEYTQLRKVKICGDCSGEYQVMFLSSKGGYDTLPCLKKVEHSADTQYSEICTDAPCNGEFKEQGLFGRKATNSTTFEKITLETELKPNQKSYRDFLLDFKASENKILIDKDNSGEDFQRRVLVEAGSVKLFEYQKKIKITFTLVYSTEYNHQSN